MHVFWSGDMQISELMEIVMKAGEIMLTSGAEIYRVEETIVRICNSYHVQSESFVLPTGIFVSARDENGCMQTAFKRIRLRTYDLNRIDRVNTFSRGLRENLPDCKTAAKALYDIENGGRHALSLRLLAAAAGSFVFAVLFNGTFYDGIAAAVIGTAIYLLGEILSRKGFFPFFELFAAGMAAGFLSLAAVRIFPALNEYRIIIGSVILLLPGMAITNGIKDALYGDLVSSFTRLGEAFMVAVALAAGVVLSVTIGINWW